MKYNVMITGQMRFLLISLFASLVACNSDDNSSNQQNTKAVTPVIHYKLLQTYPHDTTLFTEGLVFYDNKLFESSGAPPDIPFTKSVIGYYDFKTGLFNQKIEIDKSKYFGEGITFHDNKLYQLTYKNKLGFIYDAKNFIKQGEFNYSNTEGWGLTTDGNSIIMSDGTENITYLDPKTMQPHRILKITENGILRDSLNELEFINGCLYANIWLHPEIVKINTTNGNIVGKLNLSSIVNAVKSRKPNSQELNGIAYDSITGATYITGKLWPYIYKIYFEK
ncbi:glutaminyl-peptide cyclotransferase [Niabella ginsengisoli]|uniref:Glutaminyl-peptide cyclotransferase n=1 Tax=Niabella ginsengisoli TaxID=522298 RepID=A0ABS9SR06_9BACT|nr:glutaminyl-peptide cyclotransferase [Niabella ginsengisoli]MCH5600810.1 glutaminyl-peptide cyclotransferase [Niabella ginsengisoli]